MDKEDREGESFWGVVVVCDVEEDFGEELELLD